MIASAQSRDSEIGILLRGEVAPIAGWIEHWTFRRTVVQITLIVLGAGAFGAAMGSWRAPLQAFYSGVKLPLILLLTAGANSLINGMLAPLLGINLSLRQSFATVLMTFALLATILGAFSPIMLFLVWSFPPLAQEAPVTPIVHAIMLLTLVIVIAFAGVTAHARLLQLLRKLGGNETNAWRLLFAWLAINLLFGSQLSYNLRPFIGSPTLPLEFVRSNPFDGNFFIVVWHMLLKLFAIS